MFCQVINIILYPVISLWPRLYYVKCIPVITYIAGYCCYSINKKLKCDECKLRLVSNDGDQNSFGNSLIKGINRGSLLYPSSAMVHIALVYYIVFQKIASYEEFLKSRCQRSQVIDSILCTLDDELVSLDFDSECSSGHEPSNLIKMTVYICSNVLLNNYCFVKNDVLGAAKLAKRRKLQTLC